MIKTWDLLKNEQRIKIIKEYSKLIKNGKRMPKQASFIICKKYNICRKTLYNYQNKLKNMPLNDI